MSQKLLIFDLDGSTEKNLQLRPQTKQCKDLGYILAVWSVASEEWVNSVVKEIFTDIDLLFVWCGNRCGRMYESEYQHTKKIMVMLFYRW